jgi:hypothetical protein
MTYAPCDVRLIISERSVALLPKPHQLPHTHELNCYVDPTLFIGGGDGRIHETGRTHLNR